MTSRERVWKTLVNAGMTPEGAAGLMGNLQAESGIIPNRVEILCLQRYREIGKYYTDSTYTAFVDDGTITRAEFIRPMGKQYGYGLAQWTSPGRKTALYDRCKTAGASIGDLTTQCLFLVDELKTSYKPVWSVLATTHDIRMASDTVLKKYEMPADVGESVQLTRYQYAKQIYDEYAEKGDGVTADDVLKIFRAWIGYSEATGKHKQIIDIYNQYCAEHGYPRGYKVQYTDSWCDTCLSAAFIKAGAVDLIGGVECGVEEHVQIFKRKGIWIEDGTITPQPGDIIVYNWDASTQPNDGYADHIGIVESFTSGREVTIEGNYHNSVSRRYLNVGDGCIRGYARPVYAQKAAQSGVSNTDDKIYQFGVKTVRKGSQGASAALLQRLLIGWGYDPQGVDGNAGKQTIKSLKEFQTDADLAVDGVCGKYTWKKILGL